MGKIKRYTKSYYKAVEAARQVANETGIAQNVVETIYGVFYGPTSQYPANMSCAYSTVIRPER